MAKNSRRPYRAIEITKVDWAGAQDDVRGQRVIVGVDVAKKGMVAAVLDEGEAVLATVKWSHPEQSRQLVERLEVLRETAACVEVAMEPSGVYGDALRAVLLGAGFEVHRVSPKKTHDMAEVYDGVPSKHDAKDAAIVATLHFRGKSEPWPLKPEDERALKAALWRLEVFAKQFRQNRNRLEALTARHWPEVTEVLDLDTATLLELLAEFGGPAGVAASPDDARALMRRVGGPMLMDGKIDAVVRSASQTLGVPAISDEVSLVRDIAVEARRNQRAKRDAERRVEELAVGGEATGELQAVVGKTTAAVVVAATGDPREYESPQAFQKSLGLNLKEHSSGKQQNRGLHITKRGSGTARMYLHMAALRMIKDDGVVGAWYAKKVARDGGKSKIKAVVAVTRKLALGLWHVARGEPFDATKLFDTRRLSLENA